MFKYYLMGKVYKDEYVIDKYKSDNFYAYEYRYLSLGYLSAYGKEYNIKNANLEILLKDLINEREFYCKDIGIFKSTGLYENEQDYKDKHKVQEQKLLKKHIFDRYEEFDVIETDIELRDNETIKIKDKDYKVLYEYNKDLNRHELYLNYEIRIEVDTELKKQCEDKLIELNDKINEYNKTIEGCNVTIDKRFKNYTPPVLESEQKSLFIRFKNWIMNSK